MSDHKPLTEREVDELEALEKAVPSGEWSDYKGLLWMPRDGGHSAGLGVMFPEEARLAATSRNLLPRLIANWRRQNAQIETLEAERSRFGLFVLMQATCPECDRRDTCAEGCTLKAERPEEWLRVDLARMALTGGEPE